MKCEMKTSGRTTVIALEGECTIESAQQIKDALMQAVNGSDAVVLDIEKVTALDITLIQLICSAHRSSFDAKKSLTRSGDLSEICARTALKAGHCRMLSCHNDPNAECLWNEGRKTGGQTR